MRGPKPLDPIEKALRHGSRAMPTASEAALEGLGSPPGDLGADELGVWQEIAAALPAGIVRRIDRELVGRYVRSVALLRRLKVAIAELDPTDKNFATLCRLAAAESAGQLKAEAELCWTPASRSRVSAAPVRDQAAQDFDAFLSRGARSKEKSLI